jgi:hypothetical protein
MACFYIPLFPSLFPQDEVLACQQMHSQQDKFKLPRLGTTTYREQWWLEMSMTPTMERGKYICCSLPPEWLYLLCHNKHNFFLEMVWVFKMQHYTGLLGWMRIGTTGLTADTNPSSSLAGQESPKGTFGG